MMNFYQKNNTLQSFVGKYAIATILRDATLDPVERQARSLREEIARTEKVGLGIVGTDAYLEALREALKETEEKIEKIKKDVPAFKLSEVTGLSDLSKAYNNAKDDSAKAEAFRTFFRGHGFTDVARCDDYVEAMSGLRSAGRKSRALSRGWTTERTFSKGLFMNILVDQFMEAGLVKKDIVPDSLREAFEKEEAEAKARKEARKANKKNRK